MSLVCVTCGGEREVVVMKDGEGYCADCRTCVVCERLVLPGEGAPQVGPFPALHGPCGRAWLEGESLAQKVVDIGKREGSLMQRLVDIGKREGTPLFMGSRTAGSTRPRGAARTITSPSGT